MGREREVFSPHSVEERRNGFTSMSLGVLPRQLRGVVGTVGAVVTGKSSDTLLPELTWECL